MSSITRVLLLSVGSITMLVVGASDARAVGYNWTAGTVVAIATNYDGAIGVGLSPSTDPTIPPYSTPATGETGAQPCLAEGQPAAYANFYVIQPTNPNRLQFLAELMAAWLSGHIVYVYDQAAVCQTAGSWSGVHAPVLDRID